MKSRSVIVLGLVAVFTAGSLSAEPKALGGSAKPEAAQPQSPRNTHRDLVRQMVQIARDKYQAGKFEAADKILQAALEIEPDSKEARYYFALVQKTVAANKHSSQAVRPWYPTIPPRPAHQ